MEKLTDAQETANDQFKRRFGDTFWYSIVMAAMFHFVLFAFWPEMTAADYGGRSDELTAIDLPPDIEIPQPPEQIARPAAPVMSETPIDENITIPPTTFESAPLDLPSAPPAARRGEEELTPTFTPMTVRPELRNQAEVERALVRNYPPLLRDAGIGGTPVVWFLIDERGRVLHTQLSRSSGYPALDEAAISVAQMMNFSPALNRDRRVQVWVEIPIVFRAR